MTQQSPKSKTRHRGHNEGSIRPTPNGTWRAWVTLKSGKRISKTLPTKSEARDWLQQKMTEAEEALDAERTLGEYMLGWFENHSSQLKESTRCDYEIIIHKYILPPSDRLLHSWALAAFNHAEHVWSSVQRHGAASGLFGG